MTTATSAPKTTFDITITYGGLNELVQVNPNQAVEALFRHALRLFDVQGSGEGLALFDASNRELDRNGSVEGAGIGPGTTLVMRPRVVRGG